MNSAEWIILIASLAFIYAANAAFRAYLDRSLEVKRLEVRLQIEKEQTRREEIILGLLASTCERLAEPMMRSAERRPQER